MYNEFNSLTKQEENKVYTFIKEIGVNTIEDELFGVQIELWNNDTRYTINSIKALEKDLDLLWRLLESNELVELALTDMGDYLIGKVLGLTVALIKITDNYYCDLNGLNINAEEIDTVLGLDEIFNSLDEMFGKALDDE